LSIAPDDASAKKPPAPLPGRALFILPHFKLEMPRLPVGRRCRAAGMADQQVSPTANGFQVHMMVIGKLQSLN